MESKRKRMAELTKPLSIPDLTGCELVKPLVDWVEEREKTEWPCPPCDFTVITPWYRDLLEEQGYHEQAQRIMEVVPEGQDPDVKVLAQALDEIKESIDNETVKGTLTLYDCMLQSYTAEEAQSGQD